MKERFKPIARIDGLYEIGTRGTVRRADNGLILKPWRKSSMSQDYVSLDGFFGTMLRVKVCLLVAEAFLPNPEGHRFVKHKNFDRSDNSVENLYWTTEGHSSRDKPLILIDPTGEQHYFPSQVMAAKALGVQSCAINNLVKGRVKSRKGWRLPPQPILKGGK
jgi:hypothetical protein